MRLLRGIYRLIATLLLFIFYTILILLTSWLPLRIREARISSWLGLSLSRALLRLFNVQCQFQDKKRLDGFAGFIFPNHVSAFDIIILHGISPVRFLSKAEIRRWPLIGWIAMAIETVFVDRGDKSSRTAARDALLQVHLQPPLVLFPEGGISPPADELKPFRYGAFAIAAQRQMPYIPCVLQYQPLQLAYWDDGPLLPQVWEVAARRTPIHVRVTFLHPVHPVTDDDPRLLAIEAHGMMEAVLRYGGQEDKIIRDGL